MRVKLEDIQKIVQGRMSEKRFNHVLGVVETAKELAARHDVDIEAAALAALVHDVSKEQPLEQTAGILRIVGEDTYLKYSNKVWHAPMGAIVAKDVFGIENEDILNAIKYHPTGRPKMSLLEKVLFVADYTEPNRKFEGAIVVREFWGDLDRAVYEILKQKVKKVTALGLEMHPDTNDAYEHFQKLIADRGECE